MEYFKLLISPLLVAVIMFYFNRSQRKRDEKEALKFSELQKKEIRHASNHYMQIKGMLLLIDGNKLALESLKKLRDEKGKALLNGELTAMNRDICEFKKILETFIIEN